MVVHQTTVADPQQQAFNTAPNRVSAEYNRGMAVAVNQTAAAVQQQQAINIAPNRISAETKQSAVIVNSQGAFGLLEGERFEVTQTGTVVLINGYYNRTNHFIRLSREYVGGAKLTVYANFPFMTALVIVSIVFSFVALAHFIVAFILAGIDLVWFCIFVQHMYVTVKTMPHMLRLPRVANDKMSLENGFFEITRERYHAGYSAQEEAGIGIIVAEKGTVKLHILSHRAVNFMKIVMVASTLALLTFFALMIYCVVFGILGAVNGGGAFSSYSFKQR